MDWVDMPITKPLPYFWSFLFFWKIFHDHMWTKWKFTILFGTPKTKKQEEDELVQREKKHLDPLTFKFHVFLISCLFWMILKTMEVPSEILQNLFWRSKTIDWHPKILSSRMQIGHMCQLTSCMWPPSLGKGISCSFLHWFERFLLHKRCQMKGYKMLLSSKSNKALYKDL
jgi:hypothetical protein